MIEIFDTFLCATMLGVVFLVLGAMFLTPLVIYIYVLGSLMKLLWRKRYDSTEVSK